MRLFFTILLPFLITGSSRAILFHTTADPEHNTERPVGALAGSGWDLQGFWRAFLGTPIGPQYFITVGHVKGVVGEPLHFDGVAYTTIAKDEPNTPAEERLGERLWAAFNASGDENEAHLSDGDSGGGVFISEGAVWKLAGVAHSVDGSHSVTGTATDAFNASLFDQGGFFRGGVARWEFIPDRPADEPGGFYSIRLSSHLDWIHLDS